MSDVLLTGAQTVNSRQIGPLPGVVANLEFDGLTERGILRNEERSLTGLSVVNNDVKAWEVKIESEATKQSFSGVIGAGQSGSIPTAALKMSWNPDKLGGMWDGLNISWRDRPDL